MPINWNLLDRDAPLKAGMAPMQGYQGAVQNAMATQGQKQTLAQNQMALEQAQQGMDDKNRMRDIYSQGGDVQAGLQGAGFGQEAMQYGAQDTQNRVGLLQEKKLKIEDALTKFKVTGQIQSTVKDQESYDQARQQIAEILGPEAAARMPEVYNPEEIEANKQKAFTLQEQLFNQYKEIDMQLAQQKANAPSSGASPYFKDIDTSEGLMVMNARTGKFEPAKFEDKILKRSGSDPMLQGEIAGAKTKGQLDEKLKTEPKIAGSVANAKEASKLSADYFGRLEKINKNIRNIDEGIRLIDAGAETGVVASKLPSIKAASVELDNLQGRLGLDVIGSTTFGALSKSELLFALDTALPTKLDGPQLKDWFQRKKIAQTKLANYLEDASTYLGTPGNTIAGFMQERKAAAGSGTAQPAASAHPEDIQAILDKMKGN